MHFDPVVVLNHFVAPGVAEPSTMGRANVQERSLDKRIRDRIAFFVESSTSDKKYLAEAKKRLTHFIAKNLMNKIDENITKKLIVKEKKN
jgi:small subunit ribosomal protein S3